MTDKIEKLEKTILTAEKDKERMRKELLNSGILN